MKQKCIDTIIAAAGSAFEVMVVNHDCGWFDGGCYTFAKAVNECFPSTEIYHVSRSSAQRDHAVIYIPATDRYLDADGTHTREELMLKMREHELVDVTVCEPFYDINNHIVLDDIKHLLMHEISGANEQ